MTMTPEELADKLYAFHDMALSYDGESTFTAAATMLRDLAARQIKVRWQGDVAAIGRLPFGNVYPMKNGYAAYILAGDQQTTYATESEARAAVEQAAIKMLTEDKGAG